MGKIKCPYCFEEFESDKVLFRANTGFTQEELDREEFTSGDVDEHKRLFVKFSQRNPDEKLDPDANGVGADGLVRDQDGFAIRVYDRYSDRATPVTRLCPTATIPCPCRIMANIPPFLSVLWALPPAAKRFI